MGPPPASPSFPHLTPQPYCSAAEFGGHEAATEGGRRRKEVLTFLDLAMVYRSVVVTATFPSLSPSSESSPDGGRSCDVRLWLECRVMLARSLMGRGDAGGWGVVECGGQCEEGVGECEACGEVEMTAELHYTAAMHALTCEPRDLAKISSHAQVI